AKTNAIHVYRNNIGQDSNFTAVRLVGLGAGQSNRDGLGARETVNAGGVSQVLEVTSRTPIANFGLGSACKADSIEVRWPNAKNTVTTYKNVLANYPIEIHEGKPNVVYPKK